MAIHIRRREFIFTLGGAAVAWPLAASAQQQPAMQVIGFLSSLSFGYGQQFLVSFRQGLSEAGYVEGRDVSIEYRWADNQYDRLPSMAAELLQRPLAAMVASGGSVPVQAAKAATVTVPIIFTAAAYPVEVGLVASLPRPGGNITGIASLTAELDAKRMGMLREFVPAADAIGALKFSKPIQPECGHSEKVAPIRSPIDWAEARGRAGRHRAPVRCRLRDAHS